VSEWCVYIVRCADQSLYTGSAKDVAARVAQHNDGRGAKYTRGRLPVELLFSEVVGAQGDALRRELQIKRLTAAKKRRLVADSN